MELVSGGSVIIGAYPPSFLPKQQSLLSSQDGGGVFKKGGWWKEQAKFEKEDVKEVEDGR